MTRRSAPRTSGAFRPSTFGDRFEPSSDAPAQLEAMGSVRGLDADVGSLGRPGRTGSADWPRRLRVARPTGCISPTWVTVTEFFDFGAPVEIEAPPAAERDGGQLQTKLTGDW